MHELIVGVVTLVGAQKVQITASSAATTQLPRGAVHLFMTRVIVETLSTPFGDVGLVG